MCATYQINKVCKVGKFQSSGEIESAHEFEFYGEEKW